MNNWISLNKEINTSEGIGGQSTIQINKEHTQIRKCFNKDDKKYYFIEKDILLKLNNDNIIKLLSYDDNTYSLFFNYYKDGTAFKKYIIDDKIKIENIKIVVSIFRDILNALYHCYLNGITHRDIKLENILIGEKKNNEFNHHILCDFGLSRKSLTKMKRICGTYNYMSPEMWFIKKEEKYDYKTDIFSLGALIIEIVNGESPFYDEYRCRFKNVYKNLDKCLNNSTDRYYEKKIFNDIWYSNEEWNIFRKLLINMIQPLPNNRYNYNDILKELDIILSIVKL